MRAAWRTGTAIATLAIIALACTKEQVDPAASGTPVNDLGSEKLSSFPFVGMINQTTTVGFSVRKGCHGDEGTLYKPGVPTATQFVKLTSLSSPTAMIIEGDNGGNCIPDDGARFAAGSSSATPWDGPWYYVIPNQGAAFNARQILKIKVAYGGGPNNWNGAMFVYNVSMNSWSVQNGASTYFQWSFVTASDFPQPTCAYAPCGGGNG